MTQVKVFKFRVTNYGYSEDVSSYKYMDSRNKYPISSTTEIESLVNKFCEHHNVVDIKVIAVDVHYHNNGYDNTIELYYTIIYTKGE